VEKSFYSSPETAIYRRKRGIADWAAVADEHYSNHTFFLSDLLCFAVFCAVYRGIFLYYQFGRTGLKLQNAARFCKLRTSLVVEIGVFYY